MNSFLLCLNAILPSFLVILAGYAAKRAGILTEADVPRMNRVAFRVFMLVMCFYNVYSSDLSTALRPRLILFAVAGVLISYGASWLYAARFVPKRRQRGVVIQGLYRTNFLIIGLSFASGLMRGENLGTVSVTGAVIVPLFNILAVITLEAYNGSRPSAGKLILEILKNPLFLGSVGGVACLALGVRLPEGVEIAARDMARAASPLLLFLLGAFFRFSGSRSHLRQLAAVCIGRLILIPGIALSAAALAGFRGLDFVTLMALFSSSTAGASFTMAEQMGGDAALAGDIVVLTSVLCAATMFGWSLLFLRLGLF